MWKSSFSLITYCTDDPIMAAVRHLGFIWRVFGVGTGLYRCAKFGWNRYGSFDNMKVVIFCAFVLKTLIHAPIREVLKIWPLNWQHYQLHPKRRILSKTRYTTYRLLNSVHPFAQLAFPPTPKIPCFTMLFNRPDIPKVPLFVGASAPSYNSWFPGPTRLSIPNCISIGSAVFAQLTANCPYTLQWAAPTLN